MSPVHGEVDMEALKAELIRDEGKRSKPYRDTAGLLTVGIGHNLDANGVSPAVIDLMYREDIEKVCDELYGALPWMHSLDGVRQRVLLNMGFNLGPAGLLKWANTLDAIRRGDYATAANAMRSSLWASQVGKRAERLADMMETGEA